MSDRYLKVILTVIALELFWLAGNEVIRPASAQAAAVPVVITGIRLDHASADLGAMPVTVRGTVTIAAAGPLKVEADKPLPVAAVPYTPAERPGD